MKHQSRLKASPTGQNLVPLLEDIYPTYCLNSFLNRYKGIEQFHQPKTFIYKIPLIFSRFTILKVFLNKIKDFVE